MEIQELISFTTIVQQGSFSKASKKLDYCQGSITVHIKNLERELGVQSVSYTHLLIEFSCIIKTRMVFFLKSSASLSILS